MKARKAKHRGSDAGRSAFGHRVNFVALVTLARALSGAEMPPTEHGDGPLATFEPRQRLSRVPREFLRAHRGESVRNEADQCRGFCRASKHSGKGHFQKGVGPLLNFLPHGTEIKIEVPCE